MNVKETVKILKGFANKKRLEIIKSLKRSNPMSVVEISEKINLSFRSTSKHLHRLLDLNILLDKQVGVHKYYSINPKNNKAVKTIIKLL